MRKVNYLNNKDLLLEIHKSKSTFSSFVDESYNQFDIILLSVDKINIRTIAEAKRNKVKRLSRDAYATRKAAGEKVKQADCEVDYKSITKEEIIFRVMTYDHIPEEPGRKKTPKTVADTKSKVNFPPFKQFVISNLEKKEVREVTRSHWKGSLSNGKFCTTHGRITNVLGTMFLKLVERYSHRANWRGYTYVDEMRGQALVQLSQVGLQFNESKSDNPFAYYTAAVNNSFTRVLNLEKRNQNIRDDILIDQGHLPSYSRQTAHEDQIKRARANSEWDWDNYNATGPRAALNGITSQEE